MTADRVAPTSEHTLIAAAKEGDERAFELLTEPHRRPLHLHCYRMLGSLHDADDALQETLLRAWRALDRFEPRSTFGAWLHTIATNVCLSAHARRKRTLEIAAGDIEQALDELVYLQPYPDRLLDELDPATTPAGTYELRESVELAFVTAIQLLPPKQRAVLILRDVLGWSARETADALDDSVAAANSALQRARASLEHARVRGARAHAPASRAEETLLGRFMAAWDAVDIDGLVRLLAEDALLTMPPERAVVRGAEAIGEFFATAPADGRLEEIRLVPTAANRQPALAAYMRGPDGVHRPYGVMVFSLDGEIVTGITGFPDPALFPRLGLPVELED